MKQKPECTDPDSADSEFADSAGFEPAGQEASGNVSPNLSPEDNARLAYAASIRLLARRDHSIAELTRKLTQRDHGQVAIEAALEDLLAANYVNDDRYANDYAEQRMNRGYGPLSIRSKLASRGIDSHRTQHALAQLNMDWAEHAATVLQKRFNEADIASKEQRITAKIARFLQTRGFSPSDSFRALQRVRRNLEV